MHWLVCAPLLVACASIVDLGEERVLGASRASNGTGGATMGVAAAGTLGAADPTTSGADSGRTSASGGSDTGGGTSSPCSHCPPRRTIGGEGGGTVGGEGGVAIGGGGEGGVAIGGGGEGGVAIGGGGEGGGTVGGQGGSDVQGGTAAIAGGLGGGISGGPPVSRLYAQDFEAPSGDGECNGEEPPLQFFEFRSKQPDCNRTVGALSGTQSVFFGAIESILCANCWPEGQPELWVEFRMKVEESFANSEWTVLAHATAPIHERATGSAIVLNQWDELKLTCFEGSRVGASTHPAPSERGRTYLVTQHHSFSTGLGEYWVRLTDASGAPTELRGAPDGSVSCPPSAMPTSWYSHAWVEAQGKGYLDDLVFSTSSADMTP